MTKFSLTTNQKQKLHHWKQNKFLHLVKAITLNVIKTDITSLNAVAFGTIQYIADVICKSIMLACPCNVASLSPHLYIVKLGFKG